MLECTLKTSATSFHYFNIEENFMAMAKTITAATTTVAKG
jgi:hypothetical protein